MEKAIRKFDGMDIFRAHMAMDEAAKSALIEHWAGEKSSGFHLRSSKEQLARAAAYLGYELVEVVSTTNKDSEGNHIEAVVAVAS